MKQKKQSFDIELFSIGESNNPTQRPVEFILHNFEQNLNGSIIKKETASRAFPTLENMPIVCKYYPVSQGDDDALGGHQPFINVSRDGDYYIATNTLAIGIFTEPAYTETIVIDGQEQEVVKGKGILWESRYPDIIGLLQEWWNNNIPIKSSMEILYDEYHVKDGVEEILNFVYEGHCLLNSEERGNHKIVNPAYDVSKISQFQRLVAEAIFKDKEGEKMEKFQKVFELSHNDIRAKLYTKFDTNLGENQYSWIVDVYDDKFIVNIFGEGEDKYYEYAYTKTENDVEIDFESKVEVVEERKWVKVTEVQNLQAQLQENNEKLEDVQKQLNESNEKLQTVTTEKEEVTKQFNEATEKLTSLHSQVEELKPFKENYETEQYEKALNEKKEYYQVKFQAVNAMEKFESEDVQNLIKLSIEDSEEGKNAVFSISQMLVDMVQVKTEPEKKPIKEFASKLENLIDTKVDFDSRYSE